jgi:hypothetical protein
VLERKSFDERELTYYAIVKREIYFWRDDSDIKLERILSQRLHLHFQYLNRATREELKKGILQFYNIPNTSKQMPD